MRVVFRVDGQIEKEADMDAIPRTGEKVYLTLERFGKTQYYPLVVASVEWHEPYVELHFSTGR